MFKNLIMFCKYIKYNKLKLNCYGYSYGYDPEYNLNTLISLKSNKIIKIKDRNFELLLGVIYKRIDFGSSKKRLGFACWYKYKWIILGYADKKLISECSFKEFKEIYISLFFPHYVSQNSVKQYQQNEIADKLSNNIQIVPEIKRETLPYIISDL